MRYRLALAALACLALVTLPSVTASAEAPATSGGLGGTFTGDPTTATADFSPEQVSSTVGAYEQPPIASASTPSPPRGTADPIPCTHSVLPYWAIADAFVLPDFGLVDPETPYNLAVCRAFTVSAIEFWPVGEPIPAEVLEVVVRSAVGRALVTPPTIEASPDGVETPFLVQLPTLFWVAPDAWAATSATASLPESGLSVTATLTPDHMVWDPGDGGSPITCTANVPYDGTETPTGCSHVYTSVNDGEPVTVTASTVYSTTVSCQPSALCVNLVQPGPVTATHLLKANIIQVRGTIIS